MTSISEFKHISYREHAYNNSFRNMVINAINKINFYRTSNNISIGKHVQFHNTDHIFLSNGVTIGDFSTIRCTKTSKISIGNNSTLQGWNYIQADSGCTIDIGAGVAINVNSKIIGGNVSIGDNSIIAHDVSIVGTDHKMKADIPATYSETTFGDIVIGESVWIGCRSVILKNVRIGNNAIIGAGSVVTKDVEPESIVAGNPAKVIGHLE